MPKRKVHRPIMVPLEEARWALGKVWFIGAALITGVLIIQSLAGVYEDRVEAVWGWVFPNVMPTLSLMIGVFTAAALQEQVESDTMHVRRPFLRLTLGLSVFHLLAVAGTIAARPLLASILGANANPMEMFDISNLFLGPLQGLVAGVIGALFFSKSNKDATRPIRNP